MNKGQEKVVVCIVQVGCDVFGLQIQLPLEPSPKDDIFPTVSYDNIVKSQGGTSSARNKTIRDG